MEYTDVWIKVENHHNLVAQKYSLVVMTSLVGSQNYGLDTPDSDIDTCSFVLPSRNEIMRTDPPVGTEFECEDGKCVVKDLRLGINLLQRTTPNSLEWFTSRLKIYNPEFENDLNQFFTGHLDRAIYADYKNMFNACHGLSKQLSVRNMPRGKRIAHLLRIKDLWESYYKRDRFAKEILTFRTNDTREKALYAKTHDMSKEDEIQVVQKVQEYFENAKIDLATPIKGNLGPSCIAQIDAKESIEMFRNEIASTWLKLI